MAVLGVEPRRIGGVEMFARELACQLDRFGWRVVFCFLAEPPEPVRRFLDLPNLSLEVLAGATEPGAKTIMAAAKLMARHRPEILQLQFTGALTGYPWLAKLFLVKRVFLTDQTSRPEGHVEAAAPFIKHALGRVIALPLTRVIAISEYVARSIAARGFVPPSKVCCIYNAVDVARAGGDGDALRRRFGIPAHVPVVAQVSALVPEKGIEDLLEAARSVLAAEPAAHFLIVGDGSGAQQYRDRAREMGLAANFTWTGLVNDPLAEGVYAAADVVCQLSRWEEAFGWVIAEAMACRKPVVATAVGGIPEIVEDGRSGFLVPRRRPEEAADRILRLLRDPALRQRMGAAGRQAVELRFNLERNVAELLKVYGIAS